MTDVVNAGDRPRRPPGGWYPDPLAPRADPDRRRWWTGSAWTSRVRTEDPTTPTTAPAISWPPHAELLVELPEGIAWIPWLDRLAPPPVPAEPVSVRPPAVRFFAVAAPGPAAPDLVTPELPAPVVVGAPDRIAAPAPEPTPEVFAADPVVIAFGAEALGAGALGAGALGARAATAPTRDPVATEVATRPSPNRRRRHRVEALAFAAALVLLVGGAIAGADIISGGGDQRPTVDQNVIHRDDAAGFALRSPGDWRVIGSDRGTGIRFAIGTPGAPTTDTNTVSVNVGPTASELPELHTLADRLTEKLRSDFANVELTSASRTQVMGAPGFRFVFRDPDTSPPTVVEQYVGQTTSGRPLTITVTVREPRTAPGEAEIRRFVASVLPA